MDFQIAVLVSFLPAQAFASEDRMKPWLDKINNQAPRDFWELPAYHRQRPAAVADRA
jgi:hypothetical protein